MIDFSSICIPENKPTVFLTAILYHIVVCAETSTLHLLACYPIVLNTGPTSPFFPIKDIFREVAAFSTTLLPARLWCSVALVITFIMRRPPWILR